MAAVERSTTFDADEAEVWEALVDGALLEEWFDGEVDVDLRPGGALRVTSGDDVREAVVEEIDAPRRLSFTWAPDDERPGSTVELDLEPNADGCTLRVREALLDEVLVPPAFPIGFQPPPAYRTSQRGEALALARA
jgi:uncharacterized protein YndB with AHSA1/START domain